MSETEDNWLANILSLEQCREILDKLLHIKTFAILSFELKPLSYQLNGLLTEQCILKIWYNLDSKKHEKQFFVKVIKESQEILSKIAKQALAFEKESFYYSTIIPKLKENDMPYGFVPNCYLCKHPAIVLDDLTLESYQSFKKTKSLDFEQCKKGLDTLVEFHVGPMILEYKKSQELGRVYKLTEDYGELLEDKFFMGYIRNAMKYIWKILDFIPENGINKIHFKNKLEKIVDAFKIANEHEVLSSTIIHADLWSSNFLYRCTADHVQDFKLIDFQTIYYGPPSHDVVQFILTNTPFEFYKQHKDELLDYYYQNISNALKMHNLEPTSILPEDQFRKTCDHFEIYAKLFAVIDHCITALPDTILKKAFEPENFADFMFINTHKYVLMGFESEESYKKLITTDFYDLMTMV